MNPVKVVLVDKDKLTSLFIGTYSPQYVVEYVPGEWTHPPDGNLAAGYGLLVFTSAEDALRGRGEPDEQVWHCEIGEEMRLPFWGTDAIEAARKGDGPYFQSDDKSWPRGTIMVTKVKLTERIR